MSAEQPVGRRAPGAGPRGLSGVPDSVVRLEPWAALALAAHGLAVQVVVARVWWSPITVVIGALAMLGVIGLLGWRGPVGASVRVVTAMAGAYYLMAAQGPGSGYFLLWFFVVIAVHPLVLPRRIAMTTVATVPVVYILLLPFGAADGPAAVAILRAVALAVIGGFVLVAGAEFRAAVTQREGALDLLDTFGEAVPVAQGLWDAELRFLRVNAAFAAMSGLPEAEHLGRHPADLPGLDPALGIALHRCVSTGRPVEDVELSGHGRTWTASAFPIQLEGGRRGVGAIAVDVTEQRQAASALVRSVTHDALTGLPNRTVLGDRLGVALAQGARGGHDVAVLCCGIDRFREVNDSLGHAAGDGLLRVVADRVQRAVRPGDTVARLAGDEFAVLCAPVSGEAEARAIAERVRAAVREPAAIGRRSVTTTASIGVTVCRAGTSEGVDVMRDAELALEQAKDAGRDRVAVLDEGRRGHTTGRLELHAALRRAVEDEEITVAYQPVVALGSGTARAGEVVGLEALARWTRFGYGEVPPGVFIRAAEELGLIDRLGEHVLRTACRDLARWRAATGRPVTVAVNLSARQLVDPGFVDAVAFALREAGLPPQALQLEITESVLMVDVEQSLQRLADLRALGVGLAVDDFGTGYSSLAYLRDLPVDVLKIDRSFTARLPGDEALFGFVVQLARAIGAVTVVEGVETTDQLTLVGRAGCDLAQGFGLSRPLVPADAEALLLSGARLG